MLREAVKAIVPWPMRTNWAACQEENPSLPELETSLYYYRARYYDPQAGRFLNEDPPGFLSGGINFYEYVENSPLGFNDPNGLQAQPASTCCDQQKIKNIQQDLQNAFSGAAAAKSKVFQKYKPCLQKMLGDMSFQCGPPPPNKPSECGHTVTPGVVYLTANGIAGKGGCKAAKARSRMKWFTLAITAILRDRT